MFSGRETRFPRSDPGVRLKAAAVLPILLALFCTGRLPGPKVDAPRLTVVLVVDQMRAHYLEAYRSSFEHGLARLLVAHRARPLRRELAPGRQKATMVRPVLYKYNRPKKFVGGRVSGGGGGAAGTTRGAGEPRTFRAVEHVAREIVRAFLTVLGPQSPSRGRGRGPADRRNHEKRTSLGVSSGIWAKGRPLRHDGGRQHRRSPRRGAHARLR